MPAPAGLTGPPVCLMALTFAGKIWRVASEPCSVTDRDGVTHLYRGGLPELDLRDEISFLADGEPPETDIEWILPTDVALLLSQGHVLDGSAVEISLWRRGDPYERRLIMIDGEVADPGYGPDKTSTVFRVSSSASITEQSNEHPDPAWIVNSDTLDFSNEVDDGSYYPTVFGRPGVTYKLGAKAKVRATPVILINVADAARDVEANSWSAAPANGSYYLIANGAEQIRALRVRVHDVTAGGSDWHYVYRGQDLVGNKIWLAKKIGASISPTVGNIYYASWDDEDSEVGGAILARNRDDAVMEGGGEILHWALGLTGLPIQWDLAGAARRSMDQYKLAGYWDQACQAFEWIRDNLQPILPISLKWSAQGLYPVVWRHWATDADAVGHLEDGRNCSVSGDVKTEGREDVANRISLTFDLDPHESGRYRQIAVWGPDQVVTFLPAPKAIGPIPMPPGRYEVESTSEATRTSARSHGERTLELTSDIVYDRATAELVIAWMVAARAKPHGIYSITGDWRIGHINAGDVIAVTSSKHHLARQVGHVRLVEWRGINSVEVEVMVFSP